MFYYIKGTLAVLRPGFAAIDCMGVCYRLTVGTRTVAALAQSVGAEVRLFTYLSVREDGVELFGFSGEEERDVFIRLIGVSGVGPKAAVSVLSALSVGQLADCVSSGDAAGIATANGIGMKTAQKIILELKDKLSAVAADASVPAGGAAAETRRPDPARSGESNPETPHDNALPERDGYSAASPGMPPGSVRVP